MLVDTDTEMSSKNATDSVPDDGEGEEHVFVQCELCSKWRGLPADAVVGPHFPEKRMIVLFAFCSIGS